jgi:hypothetical protein
MLVNLRINLSSIGFGTSRFEMENSSGTRIE